METELLVEIKKEQVYVVLTQANIEARLQSSIAGGLSDGKWHTLTLSIEDGKRFVIFWKTENILKKTSNFSPKSF